MQRRFLTRRDLLLSGGALVVSRIASATPWPRAAKRANTYDAIVVGAGAAGIAAARTIREAGGSVLVLEALPLGGGRIRSANSPGAHAFLSVSRRRSRLYALVERSAIPTLAATSLRTNALRSDDMALAATYAAMFAALVERAERIGDGSTCDERVYDAVRDFCGHRSYRETLAHLGIHTDLRNAASLLDYHLVANRAASPFVFPADDTRLAPSGLASFVAHRAGDVPTVLGEPVASISYRSGDAVLRTATGATYRARRVIVTASTAAIASGTIAFNPALPAGIAAAVAALPTSGSNGSYATVGNAGARGVLARPVDGVLWFAGEATAPSGFGCLEGAWESGVTAARTALIA